MATGQAARSLAPAAGALSVASSRPGARATQTSCIRRLDSRQQPRHGSVRASASTLSDAQEENARLRASLAEVVAGDEAAEAARLAEENAALRAQLAARLELLDQEQRSAFQARHTALREAAAGAGLAVPALGAQPAAEPAAAAAAEPAQEAAAPAPAPAAKRSAASAHPGVVIEDAGDVLVFKFEAASANAASVPIGNAVAAAAMAVPPAGAGRSGGGSGSSGAKGDAVIFNFDAAAPAAADSAAAPGAGARAAAPTPAPAAPAEAAGEAKGKARRRAPAAPKAAAASAPKAAAPAPKPDPLAAARAAASKEAASHDPAAALAGKEHWLYLTVPSTPVAGADCVLYFNRAQSEALRQGARAQLHAKFNGWELEPLGGDRLDMAPAQGAPSGEGSDFWRVSLAVPAQAYELNFIFGDGEGVFDNNATQNYVLPVEGPVTREDWVDSAPERAEAAFLARKEAERLAAAKEAAEREAAAQQQDAEQAAALVAELKAQRGAWQERAAREGAGRDGAPLWRTLPGAAAAGGRVTLRYNRAAGPLSAVGVPEDQHLVLKSGHNGWKSPAEVAMKRAPAAKGSDDDWWEASLEVPASAAVVDFVVAYYDHYDNNGGQDHRMVVDLPSGAASPEAWADGLEGGLREGLRAARLAAAAAEAARQAEREAVRQAARDKVEAVRRLQMRHVLYTEPAEPAAGREVTLFYNPSNTCLHGAARVFLRGGYNRWRHPKGFGPLEMSPPAPGASHFSATVALPKDAYSLDFVFADAQEGGRCDNASGLDYHLAAGGSVVAEPPLYVVHVAVEMAPVAKVGGLGDVVTALARAVQEGGHQVEVILPRYDFFLGSPLLAGHMAYETEFDLGGTRVFVSTAMVEGVRVWLLEPSNRLFATATVYLGKSDEARFEFFSRAALEFLLRTGRQPDVLHCHDWSTADVAKAYWSEYHWYGLWKPAVVFTIHNLEFGAAKIGEAAYYCQRFTTVSPSYAGEIGGHPAIAANVGKLMGIRNGIDPEIWNPETDQFLPRPYTAASVVEGKAAAREELRRRVGLTGWGDKPLIGVVTRLTKQKGTHLIAHAAWRALDRGAQFVLLGSAPDPKVQAEFDALAASLGGENAAFAFAFDEPLSHLIYAACDIILVPSMFEPCGLTQMIAMRYGAVPVVRATGGLRDTVFDVDSDKGRAAWELEGSTDWEGDGVDATNGFAFDGTDAGALDYALNRALDAYYNDRAWFHSLQRRVAEQDWSWNKPAVDYISLYFAALKK